MLAQCTLRFFMWQLDVSLCSIINFMLWWHCAYALVSFRHKTTRLGFGKTKCFSHKHCRKLQKYDVLLHWHGCKLTGKTANCPHVASKLNFWMSKEWEWDCQNDLSKTFSFWMLTNVELPSIIVFAASYYFHFVLFFFGGGGCCLNIW